MHKVSNVLPMLMTFAVCHLTFAQAPVPPARSSAQRLARWIEKIAD